MPDFDPGPHPDTATLARYVHGALGRGDSRALERHLAGCLDCQAAVEEIPAPAGVVVHWAGHRFAGRPEPRADSPQGEEDGEEEARRDRLRGALVEIASVLGTLGEGFAARLLAESEHGRRALIRGDRRFQSTAVCAALLARCREAWFEDPAGAVELGKLAVAVAGHLSSQGAGHPSNHLEAGGAPDPRLDAWKALSWMHLGNAYRIASGGGAPPAPRAELAEAPPAGGPAPLFSGAAGSSAGEAGGSYLGEMPPRSEEAETALREVGEAFLERGLAAEAAMILLETAAVRLRQGRSGEIAPLAEAAAARLEAAGAGSETLAAVRRLREAAGRDEVTAAWLDAATAALRRSREDTGREPR